MKAKIDDAKFNDANEIVANADAKMGAGAFKATSADGLFGVIRGRVLPKPPFEQDFSVATLDQEFPADAAFPAYKYAYPPLPWIGARFKFQIMDEGGEHVLGKSFDRLLFQRGTVFIGTSDMKNYTVQADVMTDGNRRVQVRCRSHQPALRSFALKGNANVLEISSNFERLPAPSRSRSMRNKWYTLKTQVKVDADGMNGVVMAKVWERGTARARQMDAEKPRSIQCTRRASPGLFGFTPQNQKRVFIDNVKVTPNN